MYVDPTSSSQPKPKADAGVSSSEIDVCGFQKWYVDYCFVCSFQAIDGKILVDTWQQKSQKIMGVKDWYKRCVSVLLDNLIIASELSASNIIALLRNGAYLRFNHTAHIHNSNL